MRILTITSLYPNAAMPNYAVFVENRLKRLVDSGALSARVIAPVPWFPFRGALFGRYSAYAACPRRELRGGIEISHPRYLVIPKIGIGLQPESYLHAIRADARRLQAEGFEFDLIDAQYLYPDAVASAQLARELGKPIVLTARGTDLNVIAAMPGPGRRIKAAIDQADALIVVSAALRKRALDLGVPEKKIFVLRNGVDTEKFYPQDGSKWRALSSGRGCLLLSVGNLVKLKRHDLVIHALIELKDAEFLLAGEGPERRNLERLAREIGVAGRVHFLGTVAHHELASVYSAADILVHPSEREGWPNVLLESMACGTPVVASNVGGIPEIMTAPEAGVTLEEHSSAAIARAVRALLARPPSRETVRAHAQKFGWSDIIVKQTALYREIAERARAARDFGKRE